MRKELYILSLVGFIMLFSSIFSCQQTCIDQKVLETTKIDLRVNSENLGVNTLQPQNAIDTIRSITNQFYNYPETRRISTIRNFPTPSLINSAFAAEPCPEQIAYLTRFDATKTEFWLNVDYDASALGEGILSAETNLLSNSILRTSYLDGFNSNPYLLGGAPTFLTLEKDFFANINEQKVTFYFLFVEENGMEFIDSTIAYVDVSF